MFWCSAAFTQQSEEELIVVRGIVTAFDNFYLMNAKVSSKKTKSKVLTDSLGRYEIVAKAGGDAILFNANGFEKNRRKVHDDTDQLNVNMVLMKGEKNKDLAMAYGHMSRQEMTNALIHFTDLNRDFMVYSTMLDLLRSELLGVHVTDQNGIKVFIRGSENVLGLGHPDSDHSALFVLDGVVIHSIDYLTPSEIKSITLLKGTEAAIYGSRGAYGAVLIETKK